MRLSICLVLTGCSAAPVERVYANRPVSTATSSAIWFKAEVYCPPGTVYEGTVCKPLVVLDCAAGTKFKEGVGCVPLQPQPAPSSVGPSFSNQVQPPPANPCQCAPGDLACALRCQQRSPKFEPPPPAVPQSSSFDRGAASKALAEAAAASKACPRRGAASSAKVTLTFLGSGLPSSVTVGPPFAGTDVGECIRGAFVKVAVPPFSGPPVSVSKTITL